MESQSFYRNTGYEKIGGVNKNPLPTMTYHVKCHVYVSIKLSRINKSINYN